MQRAVAELALSGDLARPAKLTVPDLDLAGPQLVLPQDRCGARYISGVTGIRGEWLGAVDVDVCRLHAGRGFHADLKAQFLHGLAGQ